MIKIIRINNENKESLQLPNEDFHIFGKLIPTFKDETWSYQEEIFEKSWSMKFPDENYSLENIDNRGFALAAFDGEKCIGFAIFEDTWNKFMYLMDLKVNKEYRKQGIASLLLTSAVGEIKNRGYKGINTIGQDNNLAACRFYLNNGFKIGGIDNMNYKFTQQEGKTDIYFYLEF
ncbi:hypothetical protein BG262_01530 [Floricoccus penangensis]|uniref:N-acetyltransferase domain-containing protein n=1 Tax=Floricoccus penangensis TaxID=1859475 RepID=A0A9Q5JH36_9LACT|nr:GNAT family N-acetyltransferase [Floricoccus penangensis]OFI47039.1 hypothetical protein BG262_01530 [Floricoccus penangensis]